MSEWNSSIEQKVEKFSGYLETDHNQNAGLPGPGKEATRMQDQYKGQLNSQQEFARQIPVEKGL